MKIVRADVHNHLRTSSRIRERDFNRVVNIISKRLGTGGVFGLINFCDTRYEDFVRLKGYERNDLGNALYIPDKEVIIIKGQEIPTLQGHVLVLGLQKNIHLIEKRTLEDTIKEAKDNNAIIISDHPFYFEGTGKFLKDNPGLLGDIDAIEISNGCVSFGVPFSPLKLDANRDAREFWNEVKSSGYPVGGLVTSDGHSFYEIGRNYTYMPALNRKNSETIIHSLRQGVQEAPERGFGTNTFSGFVGGVDHFISLSTIIALSMVGISINTSGIGHIEEAAKRSLKI